MMGYYSPKVGKEFTESSAPLRLVVEALIFETAARATIFRVKERQKFEKGIHYSGLATDLFFEDVPFPDLLRATNRVNNRFEHIVATVMDTGSLLPSGRQLDQPHVHVQIPLAWQEDPRAFLKAYGFLQSEIPST